MTGVRPPTPWWLPRRYWVWSNRSLRGSAAAGSCCTTTPIPARSRPTTAAKSPLRRAGENYLRWISDVDHAAPKPERAPRDGRSGSRASCECSSSYITSTDTRRGATSLTPQWRWPMAVSTSAPGWPLPSPTRRHIACRPARARVFPQSRRRPEGRRSAAERTRAYSKTLFAIASSGINAFYTGDIAHDIVAEAGDTSDGRTPSLMTNEDLAGYVAKKREPLVHDVSRPHRSVACPHHRRVVSRWLPRWESSSTSRWVTTHPAMSTSTAVARV